MVNRRKLKLHFFNGLRINDAIIIFFMVVVVVMSSVEEGDCGVVHGCGPILWACCAARQQQQQQQQQQ
jgi:ABC-type transport system involved in cytochrome c biogenesis permease component